MHGAIAHEAAIWDTLWLLHSQWTEMSAAMATPIKAPTIDCVVLTGNPRRVQPANQVAEPGNGQPRTS